MSRLDKRMLFLGVVLCLLPIFVGFYYYNILPNEMAVHFDASGAPDNFVNKDLGLVGIPLFMACTFILISILLDLRGEGKKGALLVKMMIPILAVVFQSILLYYALDNSVDVVRLTTFIIAVVFIVLGNYLPKKEFWGKYNFNLFGLEKGVNEQKVIRGYSNFMVLWGLAIFLSAFFSRVISIITIICFAVLAAVLPFYFIKKYKK